MYEDDENHDEDIARVCDFTGANAGQARALLRVNDNNVHMAINYYTDHGLPPPLLLIPKLIPLAGMQTLLGRVFENGAQYGEHGQQAEIRPPTLPQADTLVDSFEAQVLNRRAAIKRPRRAGASYDGFRDFAVEANRQEEMLAMAHNAGAEDPRLAAINEIKARRLEDLFRPPIDMMFNGSFETARAVSEADGKWLMVNPQNSSEFCCQVLNRDVWSDPAIKSIVRANFVFWQVYIDSAEGLQYNQYYPVERFPYVSIIDPRTGELLKKWHTIDKAFFAEQLMNFLHKDGPNSFSSEEVVDIPLNLVSGEGDDSPIKLPEEIPDTPLAMYLRSVASGSRDLTPLLRASVRPKITRPASAPSAETFFPEFRNFKFLKKEPIDERSHRFRAAKTKTKKENNIPSTVVREEPEADTVIPQSQCEAGEVAEEDSFPDGNENASEILDKAQNDLNGLNSDSGAGSETADDLPAEDTGNELESIKLCLRFPDKEREIVSFPAFAKIRLLQKKLCQDGYSTKIFEYVVNFPKRMLCTKKSGLLTFASLGISHNDTIYISAKEKPGKEQFKG